MSKAAEIYTAFIDKLAEEVGSRPRAAVYAMLGLTLALFLSWLL